MPINVVMPAFSDSMETGKLSRWLKKVGDSVKLGDVIAEVETDKATMEIEAAHEGILAKIMVPEGMAGVPVNGVIALIASAGEDPKNVAGMDAEAATRLQSNPRRVPQPGATADFMQVFPDVSAQSARVVASPIARRLAREAGIDLTFISGSGPQGRVVERDINAYLASKLASPLPSDSRRPSGLGTGTPDRAVVASADWVKTAFDPGSFVEIALDDMRRTIANRLVQSKQSIPHFYLSVDVELEALMVLREQINNGAPMDANGTPSFKLSVNDFVIKALAMALKRVPKANVIWAGDRMLQFKQSDIAVAVAIEGGVLTPVIRKADIKTLPGISSEVKLLATRARSRQLKPEEYRGGSTTVSNLGKFGIKNFQAVINPPHATILAVGTAETRVVPKGLAPTIVRVMTVTLSCDHRAIDGVLGAELLASFKNLIENPLHCSD